MNKKKVKKKGGRPSKLTPELRNTFASLIKSGNFIETACAMVGINKSTYYGWMKKGEKSTRHTKYKKFFDEVTYAKAWCEAREVVILRKHAENNWRAAAWFLERKFPEHWGEKVATVPVNRDINCVKFENEDNIIFVGNLCSKKGTIYESRVLETNFIYRKESSDENKDKLILINPFEFETTGI